MPKKIIIPFILLSLIISTPIARGLEPYSNVQGQDLSNMDLKDKLDLLLTLNFDKNTIWPELPGEFDPLALLELGKEPGLGIRELQDLGFNGAGIVVAYIDQGLDLNHVAYGNVKLNYQELVPAKPSMHGPAVLSLLAGKQMGLIPEAEIYYFAHTGAEGGNLYEAEAFEQIIELNKTLPEPKKIKIVGMSHSAEPSVNKENAARLKMAQQRARESGIIIIDTDCGMATAGVSGYQDRENYKNYQLSTWQNPQNMQLQDRLIVPGDNRTTATGSLTDPNHYIYWGEGGFSWGVPYLTGLIAMALQINPHLTEEQAFHHLHQSAHDHLGGSFVNPKGFLERVAKASNQPLQPRGDLKNYRYFLYNKKGVNEGDLGAIKDYL